MGEFYKQAHFCLYMYDITDEERDILLYEALGQDTTLLKEQHQRKKERRAYDAEYRSMLEHFVDVDELGIPENPRIIDIACGSGLETAVQISFFGRVPNGQKNGNVDYTGIEIDKNDIFHAEWFNPKCNYVHGDATILQVYAKGRFDVALIQHPFNEEDFPFFVWGAHRLQDKGGVLVVTFYREMEMERMSKPIEELYAVIVKEQNPNPCSIYGDKKRHKYILVAQKD